MASFPSVFAVFNKETETFTLQQPIVDDDGTIARLKPWARPTHTGWVRASDEDRMAMMPWMTGQEWYVYPSSTYPKVRPSLEGSVQCITIHTQTYKYIFLGYELVWSNYKIHKNRDSYMQEAWGYAPRIPIIAFSTSRVFPRTNLDIHARWANVSTLDMKTSQKSAIMLLLNTSFVDDETTEEETTEEEVEEGEIVEDNDSSDTDTENIRRRRGRTSSTVSEIVEEELERPPCNDTSLSILLYIMLYLTVVWVLGCALLLNR